MLILPDLRRSLALLTILLVGAGSNCAEAGWMGFRNDTNGTIVIQETVNIGGQSRLGRPQRLFVGEAVRDMPAAGGQRRISVFDPANPNLPIYTGNFNCPAVNENILYCIKSDGKGGITIEAVKSQATDISPKKK